MRKGSVVVCVDNDTVERYLTIGKEYVVLDYYGEECVFINIKSDIGITYDLLKLRFKLKENIVKEEVW